MKIMNELKFDVYLCIDMCIDNLLNLYSFPR